MDSSKKTILTIAGLTFLAMFNLTFIVPSLKEIIIDRYDSTATMASLFVTVEMAAYILFGVVWGAMSDRRGERRIFIVVGFLGAGLMYYTMSLAPDVMTLLALRFVQGAFTVMAWSLLMTMALDISQSTSYGASMGIVGTGLALGIGLGAPIGGFVGELGPLYPLYFASALFIVAAALALLLIRDVPIKNRPDSIMSAIRVAMRDRRMLSPFLFGFAERFSAGYLVILLPLYLAYEFGATPSERGMYLAAFLLPFALLQYPFGKLSDKYGRRWMLVLGGAAYALLFGCVGFAGPGGVVVLMLLSGSIAGMLLPASLGLLADMASKGERATTMGGFNALGSLGFAVGPPLAVSLSEGLGYPAAFVAGAVMIAASLGVAVLLLIGSDARDRIGDAAETPR